MGIFKIFSILALTAMLIFFAIYFNIYALFIAALVPLIFVFADIFLFLLSKGCVTDISTERNTYSKKSNGVIRLAVKNRCLYPISRVNITLSVKNRFYKDNSNSYIFPLGMIFKKRINIPFKAMRSGIYDISIAEAEYSDMLGLFKRKCSCSSVYSFIVMPSEDIDISSDICGATDTDDISSDNVYSAGSGDVGGFREYRQGDKLNSINWKLSARMDKVYVKELEKSSVDEAVILFDMYCKNLDSALDNLWSVVCRNKNFYVLWLPGGAEEFESRYVSDDETAYNMLLDIFSSAPDVLEDRSLNEYNRLYKGHRFIYINDKGSAVL